MKKILIVGANSFLASKLAERLNGIKLVGLIRKSDFRVNYNIYSKVYNETNSLIKEEKKFDIIYIIGAYIPLGSIDNSDFNYVENNINLIINISKEYSNSRIIFTSSIAVYGNPLEELIKITSPFNNPSLYGLSKIAGEAIIKNHRSYAILRFSSIWGKEIDKDTFIPRLIKQAHIKKLITLHGNGSRRQNYIHFEDAVEMCLSAAELKENIVLLGVAEKSYSNVEIAKTVASYTGASIQFINDDSNPNMVFDGEESFEKISFWPKKDIIKDLIELI